MSAGGSDAARGSGSGSGARDFGAVVDRAIGFHLVGVGSAVLRDVQRHARGPGVLLIDAHEQTREPVGLHFPVHDRGRQAARVREDAVARGERRELDAL